LKLEVGCALLEKDFGTRSHRST